MTEKKIDVIRYTIFTFFVLFAFLFQTTPGFILQVRDANAMLLLPIVVAIAMFERETTGAAFGLLAGVLWDTVSSHPAGFHSIMLMLIGYVTGLLITNLMKNNLLTCLIISVICFFLHVFSYWLIFVLIPGYDNDGRLLLEKYIPSLFFTVAFVPLFYFVIRPVSKRVRKVI